MIKYLSGKDFDFTYRQVPAQNKWGDNPHLDQLGATRHLTSTLEIIDKEAFGWIRENNIPTTNTTEGRYYRVRFDNIEDAMAFKLRWM